MKKLILLAAASTFIAVPSAASASGLRPLAETFVCQQGRTRCVDRVIRRMDRRFRRLARRCDHDAIFALAYLRTTEVFDETLPAIGYVDPPAIVRQDALFADFYFDAYDAYHFGKGTVPPVWQIAFDAAETRSVTASGNALLGFNAHINRDLPLTLYQLFLEGTPVTETDHFLVDTFLAQVDFTDEIIARFDPTFPTEGDDTFVTAWRLGAWVNYQRLIGARDDAEVAAIVAQIEADAVAVAQFILLTSAYPPGQDSRERDVYCRQSRRHRL